MTGLTVTPITGVPEVRPGDDLAELIVRAAGESALRDGDVVVVAQKAVSKSEGRIEQNNDRHEIAVREARRILRRSGEMVISETVHGLVCANSGVDGSNVPGGSVVLLPLDPDLSARRIRARISHLTGADVVVVVSDTFGRAWRLGQTNVAIGVAGMDPFIDYRGTSDSFGNELTATRICIADELAGAAEMVMGKTGEVCAALVRGAPVRRDAGAATEIVRPSGEDLFR